MCFVVLKKKIHQANRKNLVSLIQANWVFIARFFFITRMFFFFQIKFIHRVNRRNIVCVRQEKEKIISILIWPKIYISKLKLSTNNKLHNFTICSGLNQLYIYIPLLERCFLPPQKCSVNRELPHESAPGVGSTGPWCHSQFSYTFFISGFLTVLPPKWDNHIFFWLVHLTSNLFQGAGG